MEKNNLISKANNENLHKGYYAEKDKSIMLALEKTDFDDCFITLQNEDINEYPYTSAYNFLKGSCDLFAYVLHQQFGYKIYKLVDNQNKMLHYFCKSHYHGKDVYIDVRGVTTDYEEFVSEFSEAYDTTDKDIEPPNFNDNWVSTGIIFATSIIVEHNDYYTLD